LQASNDPALGTISAMPARETPEQKAARLTRKVSELHPKPGFNECVTLMKKSPDIVQEIKRVLKEKGMWFETRRPDQVIPVVPALEDGATHDEDDYGPRPVNAEVEIGFSTFDIDVTVEVHGDFAHWCKISPRNLVSILHMTDPVAFNTRILKNLCAKGQKDHRKTSCWSFLEFATNIDPNNEVGEQRSLAHLTKQVSAMNIKLGRNGRELVLPVCWARDGVYQVKMLDDTLRLYKFGSPAPLDLPATDATEDLYVRQYELQRDQGHLEQHRGHEHVQALHPAAHQWPIQDEGGAIVQDQEAVLISWRLCNSYTSRPQQDLFCATWPSKQPCSIKCRPPRSRGAGEPRACPQDLRTRRALRPHVRPRPLSPQSLCLSSLRLPLQRLVVIAIALPQQRLQSFLGTR